MRALVILIFKLMISGCIATRTTYGNRTSENICSNLSKKKQKALQRSKVTKKGSDPDDFIKEMKLPSVIGNFPSSGSYSDKENRDFNIRIEPIVLIRSRNPQSKSMSQSACKSSSKSTLNSYDNASCDYNKKSRISNRKRPSLSMNIFRKEKKSIEFQKIKNNKQRKIVKPMSSKVQNFINIKEINADEDPETDIEINLKSPDRLNQINTISNVISQDTLANSISNDGNYSKHLLEKEDDLRLENPEEKGINSLPEFRISEKSKTLIEKVLNEKQIKEIKEPTDVEKHIESKIDSHKETMSNFDCNGLSDSTINIIKSMVKNHKSRKAQEKQTAYIVQTSFSLKFKYEELIHKNRMLPLPSSYKQILYLFGRLDEVLNSYRLTDRVPYFSDIKKSLRQTYAE